MATHLPPVNEPLNIFHLHDSVGSELPETIQVSPGAIQHLPGVLYRILIDIVSLPCFGTCQHGVYIAADRRDPYGDSGKPVSKRIRARRRAIVPQRWECCFEGSQVIVSPRRMESEPRIEELKV